MGTIKKLGNIIKANINSFLNSLEDPEKMIDQELANAEKELFQLKAKTASVMAEEKRIEKMVNICKEDICNMEKYATLAVKEANDDDAVKYLSKKKELELQLAELEETYKSANQDSQEMQRIHDEYLTMFTALKSKQNILKSKAKVAKTKAARNKYIASKKICAHSTIANFKAMEEKINMKLDEANALKMLERTSDESELILLSSKYDQKVIESSIKSELEELKKAAGM